MTPNQFSIGMTQETSQDSPRVVSALDRTFQFDPGDTNNLDQMMDTVSAMMDDQPSVRWFLCGEDEKKPPLIVFLQPKSRQALVVLAPELVHPQIQNSVIEFGFNPETLQPL